MSYTLANFIRTSVAATFGSSSTTLQVASSTGLPSPTIAAPMPVILTDAATGLVKEIVYATSISGSNLTVVRAREGTAAQNWNIGDLVNCDPTAGTVATVGSSPFFGLDAGAADTYAVSIPQVTAYTTGLFFGIKIANTNLTTTPTVNVSALGAENIVREDGTAVALGDLPIGGIAWLTYDGTNMQLINPRTAVANRSVFNAGPGVTNTGYIELPGGFIINWGQVDFTLNGTQVSTFAKAFPNKSLSIVWTGTKNSAVFFVSNVELDGTQPSATSLTQCSAVYSGGAVSDNANYICIGY